MQQTHWKSFTNIYGCPGHTSQKARREKPGKILSEVTVTAKHPSKKGYLFPEIIKPQTKKSRKGDFFFNLFFLMVKTKCFGSHTNGLAQNHCGKNSCNHMGYLSK